MANNPTVYDAACIAAVNAFTGQLNVGGAGTLQVWQGSQPALNGALAGTLLATLTFSATAFPTATAAGGTVTATANAITNGIAGNTGTAQYFALVQFGGTVVATGTCGTASSDLNLSTTSISAGQTVSCSSFLVTMLET